MNVIAALIRFTPTILCVLPIQVGYINLILFVNLFLKEIMAETLYGTLDESHSLVMSERVQNLASCIYREFECMIRTYGDSVIKGLMPHIVSVLENLNQAYREKQDHEVEIELLRVENDNLKKQFEKEKQLRKNSEQVRQMDFCYIREMQHLLDKLYHYINRISC